MAVPDFQTLMCPLLEEYADGGERPIAEVRAVLGTKFALTPEELAERLPSGLAKTFDNRVGWAATYLYRVGLLARPRRSVYAITERGREVLSAHPEPWGARETKARVVSRAFRWAGCATWSARKEQPTHARQDSTREEYGSDNAFIRDGDRIFRTYFIDSRGDEAMGSTWSYLDITALGRQEEWEVSPEGYPQTPPYQWWNRPPGNHTRGRLESGHRAVHSPSPTQPQAHASPTPAGTQLIGGHRLTAGSDRLSHATQSSGRAGLRRRTTGSASREGDHLHGVGLLRRRRGRRGWRVA